MIFEQVIHDSKILDFFQKKMQRTRYKAMF